MLRVLAGPGTPLHPVVKADAYGHGAIPIARRWSGGRRRRPVRGHARRGDRAPSGGHRRARSSCCTRSRRPRRRAPAGRGSRSPPATSDLLAGAPARRPERRPAIRDPLELQLEVETGLGRGGFDGRPVVAAATLIVESRARSPPGERLDPPPGARGRAADGGPGRAVREGDGEALQAGRRSGCRRATSRPAAACSLDGVASARWRPARPRDLRARARGAAPAARRTVAAAPPDLRPVLSLHARPVRVADLPAGWGISYGPTFTTIARPAESPRCRSATATAGRAPSRIARKRWFAAGACRSSATSRWTR